MLPQRPYFTKSLNDAFNALFGHAFSKRLFSAQTLFPVRHGSRVAALILPGLILCSALPSWALLRMETKTINAALVYGMRNQKAGLSTLLGSNWIENGDGALLNVYSPFMMLASKAAKAGLSSRPTPSDLQQARKRFGKEVAYYSDPKNKPLVKFALSFYGDSPQFARSYTARIVGIGRGKTFDLKPKRQNLDQIADPVGRASAALPPSSQATDGSAPKAGLYEAINAYYFPLSDLVDLQEFQLIIESPTGPPLTFRINNERLY